MILADADVLVDFLSGEGACESVREHVRARTLATSAVAVFEVSSGLARPEHRDVFLKLLRGARVLPFDARTAHRAGELWRDLQRAGHRIGHRDTMIAATALVANMAVLTRNVRHFERVPGLRISRTS